MSTVSTKEGSSIIPVDKNYTEPDLLETVRELAEQSAKNISKLNNAEFVRLVGEPFLADQSQLPMEFPDQIVFKQNWIAHVTEEDND